MGSKPREAKKPPVTKGKSLSHPNPIPNNIKGVEIDPFAQNQIKKGYMIMNRQEVIATVKAAGGTISLVMGAIFGEDYEAGYRRAVADIIKAFEKAPLHRDFEDERSSLNAHIRALQARCGAVEAKNEALVKEISALNHRLSRAEKKRKRK